MQKPFYVILVFILFTACNKNVDPQDEPKPDTGIADLYFPPIENNNTWETTDPSDLNWNLSAISALDEFIDDSGTRALLLLKDGKIVVEKYAGNSLLGGTFDQNSNWYWASAAKTLTSTLVGIAEQKGHLTFDDPSNLYLDEGWSSLSVDQEQAITVRHHLTMTTGLETKNGNHDCTDKECLTYRTDPNTRWFYHNAPYTLLDGVVSGASNTDFDQFFADNLKDQIGMDGFWTYANFNHLYFSTARSMAKFGLMVLNKGQWVDQQIVNADYVSQMTTPSQGLNKSYGYLWWLNGYESHILPGLGLVFPGPVTPNAPSDGYAAMGKNGQILYIIPSEQLILIRLGDNPDNALVPTKFVNELWEKINSIIYP